MERVLVAIRNEEVRHTVVALLQASAVFVAGSCSDMIRELEQGGVACVLADIRMLYEDKLETTLELGRRLPKVRKVVVSGDQRETAVLIGLELAERALRTGASHCMTTCSSSDGNSA